MTWRRHAAGTKRLKRNSNARITLGTFRTSTMRWHGRWIGSAIHISAKIIQISARGLFTTDALRSLTRMPLQGKSTERERKLLQIELWLLRTLLKKQARKQEAMMS